MKLLILFISVTLSYSSLIDQFKLGNYRKYLINIAPNSTKYNMEITCDTIRRSDGKLLFKHAIYSYQDSTFQSTPTDTFSYFFFFNQANQKITSDTLEPFNEVIAKDYLLDTIRLGSFYDYSVVSATYNDSTYCANTVTNADTTIQTRAGTFHCMKIYSQTSYFRLGFPNQPFISNSYQFYNSNVGLIKIIIENDSLSLRELIETNINHIALEKAKNTIVAEFISVSPNPFCNHIAIKINGIDNQPSKLTFYDISGRLISAKSFSDLSPRIFNLKTPQLPKGTYILNLLIKNKSYAKKITKN